MKRKILYILITAVIGVAAFFGGKNLTVEPEKEKAPEIIEMTVESGGLYLEYSDGENFYSHWIPTEKLEENGLIYPGNIVDWNTGGQELAIMTENDFEWYAQQTEEIY